MKFVTFKTENQFLLLLNFRNIHHRNKTFTCEFKTKHLIFLHNLVIKNKNKKNVI